MYIHSHQTQEWFISLMSSILHKIYRRWKIAGSLANNVSQKTCINKNVFPFSIHTHPQKNKARKAFQIKHWLEQQVNKHTIQETHISQYIQQDCNVPALLQDKYNLTGTNITQKKTCREMQ